MDITTTVLDYVKREYLEEGDERDVSPDTPLITGGIVDSFSMVSLKRFLERKYAIAIPDREASPEAFNTVASIVALVERRLAIQHTGNGTPELAGAAPAERRTS